MKLAHIWDQRVLFKWFGMFRNGLLLVKRKRQVLQRCLTHRRKWIMSQSIYWWHQLSRGERIAQTVSKVVLRMRTQGVIRKLNRFWRLACSKALYRKRQYNRAKMACFRCYFRKVWNRWLQLAETAANYQYLAGQFYANKVKCTILSRWIFFHRKTVEKATHLLASSKQRETILTQMSFKCWYTLTKNKRTIFERSMSFIHRSLYKIKRNFFQHWFQGASRNKRKRDFRMFLIMKKERHRKRVVFSHLASRTLQRKLINNFILVQSSKRG